MPRPLLFILPLPSLDYEQQRLQLLHKHGIDLEISNSVSDNQRTRRMSRKDVELLMGGEGQGGLFTWRDKNRRKVALRFFTSFFLPLMNFLVGILGVRQAI